MLNNSRVSIAVLLPALLAMPACRYIETKKINCVITASPTVNLNVEQRPSPIIITIMELKRNYPFTKLEYETLHNAINNNNNLINQYHLLLRPSETKYFNFNLSAHTRYLGVIADYRDLENTRWKRLITLPNKKTRIKLKITLSSNSINYQVLK